MHSVEDDPSTRERYRAFADHEALGRSETFWNWADGIAADPEIAALIDRLPFQKRQPNLVFAAARHLDAPTGSYGQLRAWLIQRWADVEALALRRTTQTNEPGRCATLLPVLSAIEGPIALLEVGASAGLCLYPDRYCYRYVTREETVTLDPATGPRTVVLTCEIADHADIPTRLPEIVWRAGIDLNPLDVADPDDKAWLLTLVWPEHDERRRTLTAAADMVRSDPPILVAGDLNEQLEEVAARAPAGTSLVVFHSAVLFYLSPQQRSRFIARVRSLDAVWLSNEAPQVVPDVAQQLPNLDHGTVVTFVLAQDGNPVALTDPHGRSYRGLGRPS